MQTPGCLLTFGLNGDVELQGHKISRVQFQIQLHPKTLEILIRDTSSYKNTKILNWTDPESLYFSTAEDMPRQVVIRHGDPIILSAGGENKDLYQFEIVWPPNDVESNEKMVKLKEFFVTRRTDPRFLATQYETPSRASRYESRVHSPGGGERWLHRKLEILGAGTFGEVYKTLNMHTGEYFAVKTVRRSLSYATDTDWRKMVLEEVRSLEDLSNRHVVQYYHSQGFKMGTHPIEIFMALYEGTVESLVVEEPRYRMESSFLTNVYGQMLKALMYIAWKGIIHRDMKPANILYVQERANSPGSEQGFRFVLADFGLSKEQIQARTQGKGSPLFMAPEMRILGAQQSHKVDVYSLGVTMLALCDAGEIISRPITSEGQIQRRLQAALRDWRVGHIAPLLRQTPDQRPSAQQIFLKHWPADEEAQRMAPQEAATPSHRTGTRTSRPRRGSQTPRVYRFG